MTIGERLLELRKKKGLSQEEVANILSVSRQTISKWETDQSTPDFDKIVPICELYEISANELLNTNKSESNYSVNSEILDSNIKIKSAKNIAISVSLYILSVIALIYSTVIGNNPIIGVCIFLFIVAIATGIIVYNGIINKKPKRELTKNEIMEKHINEAISIMIVIIYFIVSFITMAWYITWVLFLVNGLLEEIVKLIFSIKEGDSNE